MHVTSNPYFVFHDDVFPAFSKNAVAQPRFPIPSFFSKTIIPDKFHNNSFSSLKELKHISTLEIDLTGENRFEMKFNFQEKKLRILKDMEIFKFELFDETILFDFGIYKNGSIWIDSDYFDKRVLLQSTFKELRELGFSLNSHTVEVFEEELRLFYLYSFYLLFKLNRIARI